MREKEACGNFSPEIFGWKVNWLNVRPGRLRRGFFLDRLIGEGGRERGRGVLCLGVWGRERCRRRRYTGVTMSAPGRGKLVCAPHCNVGL